MTALIGIQTDNFSALCSDRRTMRGHIIGFLQTSKIMKKNDFYIGFAGRAGILDNIRYDWNPPKKENKMSDDEYIFNILSSLKKFGTEYNKNNSEDKIFKNFSSIISYNGTVFETNDSYERCNPTDKKFISLGCGYSFIEGILMAETENKDVSKFTENQCRALFHKCLKSASKYSAGISKECDIYFDYKRKI